MIAGDWHGNIGWAATAIAAAAAAGASHIVHVGDLGIWPGRDGEQFLFRVQRDARRGGIVIVFVACNHENHDAIDATPVEANGLQRLAPNIWHIPRGHRWVWHGRTWVGLGGAHSVDRGHRTFGHDWWPQEYIRNDQAAAVIAGGKADVMICHDVPLGVPVLEDQIADNPHGYPLHELRAAYAHRMLLRTVVDAVAPAHLWHGHYHVAYDDDLILDSGQVVHVHGLDMDGTPKDVAAQWAATSWTDHGMTVVRADPNYSLVDLHLRVAPDGCARLSPEQAAQARQQRDDRHAARD